MKPMDLLEVFGELPEEDFAWMLNYEPPRKRTAFLVSKPFLAGVSTAACLLLIVGLGVGDRVGAGVALDGPPRHRKRKPQL